jgi:hypothetical protein
VISGFNAGDLAAKFYFDEQSGLLLRILRYVNSPAGTEPDADRLFRLPRTGWCQNAFLANHLSPQLPFHDPD